jgi:hypothetical protein
LNTPILASPTPKEKHQNLMQRIELIRNDRSPKSYQKYRPDGYQQHREEAVSNNIRKGIF